MKMQDRRRYVGVGNFVVDTETGRTIRPGDPDWRPEWSAVNAANASAPEGYHPMFEGSQAADPSVNDGIRTPSGYARNAPPWYLDPALMGMFAMPVAAAAFPALTAAGGAGGAGGAADAAGSMFAAGGPEAAGAAASAVQASVPAVASAAMPAAAATLAPAAATAAGHAGTAAAASLIPGVSNAALFQTGAGLFGNIFGAWMAGRGADQAAQQASQAAEYAARLQYEAQQQALQFNREQAENAYLNSEAARKGNYDIYAAGQRRLGFIGSEVGMPNREIPGYVPGVDPNFNPGGGSGAPGAPGAGNAQLDLVRAATAKGLRGQAAVDWMNQQQPGAAVVVPAGSASPPGKIVWYDKGALPNGTPSGKFQVAGQWEYSDDPSSWQNGAPTGYRYVPIAGGGGAPAQARPLVAPYSSGPPAPFYQGTHVAPIPGYLGGY